MYSNASCAHALLLFVAHAFVGLIVTEMPAVQRMS